MVEPRDGEVDGRAREGMMSGVWMRLEERNDQRSKLDWSTRLGSLGSEPGA